MNSAHSPLHAKRQLVPTTSPSERIDSTQFGDTGLMDRFPTRAAEFASGGELSTARHRPSGPRVAEPAPRPWSYRSISTLLLLGWACGTVLLLLRLQRTGTSESCATRCASTPLLDTSLRGVLDDICHSLGLQPPPQLLVLRHVSTPLATGILSPVIILPERLLKLVSTAEMRDLLWHEAAHVSRRDPAIVLLQEVARAFYWPIPPVHGLIRELGRAREDLCDNHVLQHRDAVGYGETLLHLAVLSQNARPPFPAIGMLQWKGELERRIGGFLDQGRSTMTRNNRRLAWPVALLFVVVGTIASGTRLSAGGQASQGAGETRKPENSKSSLTTTTGRNPGQPLCPKNRPGKWST